MQAEAAPAPVAGAVEEIGEAGGILTRPEKRQQRCVLAGANALDKKVEEVLPRREEAAEALPGLRDQLPASLTLS